MTNQSTIDKLIEMRLSSMADAFRIQMNDTLNVLYSIAVAVAVPQTAVYKRCGTGPDKGDEALISVPDVDHVVERIRRCADLEMVQLAVPVFL